MMGRPSPTPQWRKEGLEPTSKRSRQMPDDVIKAARLASPGRISSTYPPTRSIHAMKARITMHEARAMSGTTIARNDNVADRPSSPRLRIGFRMPPVVSVEKGRTL